MRSWPEAFCAINSCACVSSQTVQSGVPGESLIADFVAHAVLNTCMPGACGYAQHHCRLCHTKKLANSVSIVCYPQGHPGYLRLCQSRYVLLAQSLQPSQCHLVTLSWASEAIQAEVSVAYVNLQNKRSWLSMPEQVTRAFERSSVC